jgi:hypothetical protein
MRHEQFLDKGNYNKVSVAAVWPVSPLMGPLPIMDLEEPRQAEVFAPTPAAQDVPAAVGGLLVAAYAALIGAFALATVGSAESLYVVTISALFVVTFFTVPRIFLAVEPKVGSRPSFDGFMREGLETLTGHCTGGAALVQMLIVPVLLTFAALAMGVAAAIMR